MAQKPPYLASPGSIDTALERVKNAATPERFTRDFVQHVLKIKGGAGTQIPPFFKKIGFSSGDGTPTHLYDQFRNSGTSGAAISGALRHGYSALYEVNEYAHKLSDDDLKGLIVQVTGLEADNRVVALTLATFKRLKKWADFDTSVTATEATAKAQPTPQRIPSGALSGGRINLAYTINLNLPATTNIEVFHAIFASLKQHLIDDA